MMKKNIAIVAGGFSGEYVISEKSARMIKAHIDPSLFNAWIIMITRDAWVHIQEDGSQVAVDKNDFTIQEGGKVVRFDCAFITIHGTPGEDGKLQGYFDLIGMPYTTSGLLPAALTFNKYFCNQFVGRLGVHVARSMKLTRRAALDADNICRQVSLPVFVKPNKGGSSLGTHFVKDSKDLLWAIGEAFEHDNEALIEEYIEGEELTCGVFSQEGKPRPLPVTLVRSKSGAGFFDFKAKYTRGASEEITPAPIDQELTRQIQDTTAMLYEALELKGIARIDYIFSQGKLYFLEVNVTPGMSDASIVPQQAAVAGMSARDLFTCVIREAIGQ